MGRTCTACSVEKSLDQFYRDPRYRSGRSTRCKLCDQKRLHDWSQKHPAKAHASCRRRRLAKKSRVPKWADLRAIADFYEKCPKGHHVDHLLPLQGSSISGLHVLENLRYLPSKLNYRKGNRCPTPLMGTDQQIEDRINEFFKGD